MFFKKKKLPKNNVKIYFSRNEVKSISMENLFKRCKKELKKDKV